MDFVGNLLFLRFLKSVKNWQSYHHELGYGTTYFWDTVGEVKFVLD